MQWHTRDMVWLTLAIGMGLGGWQCGRVGIQEVEFLKEELHEQHQDLRARLDHQNTFRHELAAYNESVLRLWKAGQITVDELNAKLRAAKNQWEEPTLRQEIIFAEEALDKFLPEAPQPEAGT